MKAAILLLAIFSVFLAGCQQVNYVCDDGSVVQNMMDCPKEETRYEIIENITDEKPEDAIGQEKPEPVKKPQAITEFEGDFHDVGLEVADRGITLRFIGYYYVQKSEDFGKITAVKYSIKNDGAASITPALKLSMINNIGERSLRLVDVEREQISIGIGEELIETSKAALSFNMLDIEKTLELDIYDRFEKGTHLFTVKAKEDFS